MAIGGKRQRSALTVSSNHEETSQPMHSTPGTAPRVSGETPLSSPPLAQSSVASTTPVRRGRGKSRGVTFAKVRASGKMSVNILDGHRGTDGDESSRLATLIGTLFRMHAPFGTPTWAKVPNSVKEYIRERVLDDFELNYDRQEDRETVNSIMNAAFKNHKAKLHKHFKKFGSKDEALQHRPADTSVENWIACCELFSQPSYQDRSQINTNNRAKLKVHHTGGSRPFVWHRKKLQDPEAGMPTAANLYSKTHNRKNGEGWVSDVAREYYEKMVEIQSQSTTKSGAPKDVDIFTQVLGKRSGYVRGLGRSVKPIAALSSTVSIQRAM